MPGACRCQERVDVGKGTDAGESESGQAMGRTVSVQRFVGEERDRMEENRMGMNVEEFQRLLAGMTERAAGQNHLLTLEDIKVFLGDSGLEPEQMKKVLQYLKVQGITVEGMEHIYKEEQQPLVSRQGFIDEGMEHIYKEETASVSEERTPVPLNPEERAYLKSYREDLKAWRFSQTAAEELFLAFSRGDRSVLEELIHRYLSVAADLAEAENCEEIPFPDLLAEANLSLVAALDEEEPRLKSDAWLRERIRLGIRAAVEEQTRRNFSDDYLVSKVEKLDRTIRELTDEEEGEKGKFSVQELSVILDMDVEEIQDVLRLAGEGE